MLPPQFDQFYRESFGERWPSLLAALTSQNRSQTARINQFSKSYVPGQDFRVLESAGEIPRDDLGLLQYYVMDLASVFAARALDVQPGDSVLDMCAAPGGKTLVLAEKLQGQGELIANEPSGPRRERLKKVLQQYIPREERNHIWVNGKDAGLYAISHPGHFDRILVDAPCSGEEHLLETPAELKEWKVSRSEKLAQRQYALLTAALLAVKSGGRIVYSTCALSPFENDQVIERLLTKKKDQFEVVMNAEVFEGEERTSYGRQFLPDRSGLGPIYFSILRKL